MEQGKGKGRLQQVGSMIRWVTNPHESFNSRDNLGDSIQGISHINRSSVVVQRWGHIKGGKDRGHNNPSAQFSEVLARALTEIK